MKQNPKRKKSIVLRLLLVVFSAYMVLTLINEGKKLETLKAEESKLKEEKISLELSIKETRELLASDSHAEIIEKAAREKLGFVYSDEEIYIDISGN